MPEQLIIYDTTLRDGSQSEGISFSALDKIMIAQRLDDFGVNYIEGGWPGSNPKDMEFFTRAVDVEWKNAKIAAFGSTRRVKSKVWEDANIKLLLEAKTPVVTIFGKTWDLHVTEGLRTTLDINLELIRDSIAYLKDQGKEVVYDAEHFFDGYKDNPEYALKTLEVAKDAGADCLVLCDTNGGTLPSEVKSIIDAVYATNLNIPLGMHAHNDGDVAVANSIVALENKIMHIQGTMNGYGERCGNANLCTIIANAALKMNIGTSEKLKLNELTQLSRYVSEMANLPHREEMAFVGNSAFAHKGGIHVSAIRRNRRTYEHIDPATIGNRQRVLISDQSGQSNILQKAEEMGLDLTSNKEAVHDIVNRLKDMEHLGYQYEGADGSFEILINKSTGEHKEFFDLESARVIIDKHEKLGKLYSEAMVKMRVGGKVEHTAAEGNGPIDALDNAMRKALEPFYPSLKKIKLIDYKVRVLNSTQGTAAKVRVYIESQADDMIWGTVGVSENIIEASWQALVDRINYMLLKLEKNNLNGAAD